MPPKKYTVKLAVPSKFLATLPVFEVPASKTRVKKLAAEDKKTPAASVDPSVASSKTSSPQPETGGTGGAAGFGSVNNAFNNRINSGLKESSTSGLTMNPIAGQYSLDKSGKPVNRWMKRQTQFKTFTGFKVKYYTWKQKKKDRRESISKKEDKEKVKQEKKVKEVPIVEVVGA
ncbi:hypothetical protein PSN45_000995 [Yamadazyma tenuis]|uniref:Uncharacterized protein n=1 Tax=Candida tenuis (strain ATCC 10573 / BCRC 21748 / CBS 615 / JCM 9827 / NBRC 10315 / NRRL Y-1498 / VKM Y-70) TaxID=590646 RepID=G3B7G8_CANTC|nr:uncharacterized protein CANTEDRAFT_115730 [Yamadazyma tenuis ATCC 10573]EGV62274.1 hypothetical protein CANTEDRAFT_115730 [Yamadazyma tenuis ATCC 10573]WEJ93530.1 hypothetical protein PSN45_000995 [Yamadazyma tenuis]